jgi:hypothetical protein
LAGSAKLSQPTGQKLSNVRRQQKKFSIGPILFLYYEESLASSNLNSKQLRFHCAHPNVIATYFDVKIQVRFAFSLALFVSQVSRLSYTNSKSKCCVTIECNRANTIPVEHRL